MPGPHAAYNNRGSTLRMAGRAHAQGGHLSSHALKDEEVDALIIGVDEVPEPPVVVLGVGAGEALIWVRVMFRLCFLLWPFASVRVGVADIGLVRAAAIVDVRGRRAGGRAGGSRAPLAGRRGRR